MGVAFGLASLAGINLYLTVFVTGLAINQHWVVLSPQYQHLAPLGHPAVVVVAGILYFIQFFADKVPWVDSLWDSIHTVIRPSAARCLPCTPSVARIPSSMSSSRCWPAAWRSPPTD